jgi:sodium/proline symporter
MATGTVVLVLWKQAGLTDSMYEIVPGFIANSLTIFMINLFIPQKDQTILNEFDEVLKTVRST